MSELRKIPAPHVEEETRAYWDGVDAGKLLLKFCRSCNSAHHYPRSICPHCGSDDTYFTETSGRASIYSFSILRVAPIPYAIAYVTLEGTDVTMMTNIINCDFDALEVGQPVKACFVETEGDGPVVPMFEPA
ncbi:MAG: OB-fold domain-containing protein [Sneathiella sp.]|nr:OB-fold domain-containing protein [Sneathiella sp.]